MKKIILFNFSILFLVVPGLYAGNLENKETLHDLVDSVNLTDNLFDQMEKQGQLTGFDEETIQTAEQMVQKIISDEQVFQAYLSGDLQLTNEFLSQYFLFSDIKKLGEKVLGGIKTAGETVISGISEAAKKALPLVQTAMATVAKTASGILLSINQNPETLAKIAEFLSQPIEKVLNAVGVPPEITQFVQANVQGMLKQFTGLTGTSAGIVAKLVEGNTDVGAEVKSLLSQVAVAGIKGVAAAITGFGNPVNVARALAGGGTTGFVPGLDKLIDSGAEKLTGAIISKIPISNSLEEDNIALAGDQAPMSPGVHAAALQQYKQLVAATKIQAELLKTPGIERMLGFTPQQMQEAKQNLAKRMEQIQKPFITHASLTNTAGKCLDADTFTINQNGTKVQVWGCSGAENQKWSMNDKGQIVDSQGGRCLNVHQPDYDAKKVGGKVQLWDCVDDSVNDKFILENNRIKTRNGMCIGVNASESNRDGGLVRLLNCSDPNSLQWNKQD